MAARARLAVGGARPDSPLDDVVPAQRPITVEDLLTFRAGYGFPSDFALPAVQPLLTPTGAPGTPGSRRSRRRTTGSRRSGQIPLLHQPGEAWLYNTCSDILGVLIARACGQPLPEFLAERVFEPLGHERHRVPRPRRRRLGRLTTSYYRAGDGERAGARRPAVRRGRAAPPAFPSGAGGLVSTADDWLAFGRMLLGGRRDRCCRRSRSGS